MFTIIHIKIIYCIHIYIYYIYIYIRLYVRRYICICICKCIWYISNQICTYIYICMCTCICICICCIYVHMSMYIYLYTYIFVASGDLTDRSHGKSPSPIGKAAINRLFNIDFPWPTCYITGTKVSCSMILNKIPFPSGNMSNSIQDTVLSLDWHWIRTASQQTKCT